MSCSMGNVSGRNSSPSRMLQTPFPEAWKPLKSPPPSAVQAFPRIDSIRSYLEGHGYKLGEGLGEGSYSKVKACTRYSSVDGKFMYKLACKIIDKCRASDDFVTKFLPRELKIVRELNHPNIVRVWDIVQLRDYVYIFMDFCHGGDMLEYVKAKGLISESRSRHYFKQIVSAVRYLHSLDIAHRDLKCENVLLTGNDQIKISDFGFARYCHNAEGKRILSNTYCGSAAYAAPEILQGTGYNPKLYDCWSIGCVLFIMVTGHMPFDESDIPKMLRYQMERKLTFPAHTEGKLSVAVKLLIRRLLEPDVTRRGNIEVAANHEWSRAQQYRSSTSCDGDGSVFAAPSSRTGTFAYESGSSSPRGSIGSGNSADSRDGDDSEATSSSSASPRQGNYARDTGNHVHQRRRHIGSRNGHKPEQCRTPRSGTAKVSSILDSLSGEPSATANRVMATVSRRR